MSAPVEQLPDRPFEKSRNFRFFAFLFRRPFMLVPGLVGAVGIWAFGAWLVQRGLERQGAFPTSTAVFALFMGVVGGFGTALLCGLLPFVVWRRLTGRAPEAVAPAAAVLQCRAIHWRGPEPRNGTLTVAGTEVAFRPNAYALNQAPVVLGAGAVRGLKWFRSPDPQGFGSTSTLLVVTGEGEEEFVFESLDEAGKVAGLLAQLAA